MASATPARTVAVRRMESFILLRLFPALKLLLLGTPIV